MRATTIHGLRDVRFSQVPDPQIQQPTDAIVRVVAGCICGSDLWNYRGINTINVGATIGHECIGEVVDVGAEVRAVRPGDFVIVPFDHCDNTCAHCLVGMHSVCDNLGFTTSGQGEFTRVNYADGSLVKVEQPSADLHPALLALSDVMPTGWHAAVSARVRPGHTVVVVGDGAVGLCGVLAAAEMGAERIIAMSRHADRQAIATRFGATDVIAERGADGEALIAEMTRGVGADAVLECVGTDESMNTALNVARPGATVGFVGVPHGVNVPIGTLFSRNVGISGGMAPVRAYLDDLTERVLSGRIDPSPVFDLTLPMTEVADGYAAMDERRATKVMLTPA